MFVRVTDVYALAAPSGRGLRFTLTFVFDEKEEFVHSVKGCLAFRDRKSGKVKFLAPVMYLGTKRIRYRNNISSPALIRLIEAGLEKNYGQKIQAKPGPLPTGTPINEEYPEAPEGFDIRIKE